MAAEETNKQLKTEGIIVLIPQIEAVSESVCSFSLTEQDHFNVQNNLKRNQTTPQNSSEFLGQSQVCCLAGSVSKQPVHRNNIKCLSDILWPEQDQ